MKQRCSFAGAAGPSDHAASREGQARAKPDDPGCVHERLLSEKCRTKTTIMSLFVKQPGQTLWGQVSECGEHRSVHTGLWERGKAEGFEKDALSC